MTFIEDIADWNVNKSRLLEAVNFLNSFATIDDNQGTDNKVLTIFNGNSRIDIAKDYIEISQGTYQATKLRIEKDVIYFKFYDGSTLDMSEIKTFYDMVNREQDFQEITVSPPLTKDNNDLITIPQATTTIDGYLAATDWTIFNNKQNSSLNLTGLSNLNTNGLIRRTGAGTFTTDSTVFGTMASQNANVVNITGGSLTNVSISNQTILNGSISGTPINNSPIGANTPSTANFTSLILTAPNTSTVPFTINVLSAGQDTLRVIRQDLTVGFKILNSGSIELSSGSFYRHSGNAVVGARRTGWSSASGTATRTGFVTSNATTEMLAERLKALLDDLIAHGLIGS